LFFERRNDAPFLPLPLLLMSCKPGLSGEISDFLLDGWFVSPLLRHVFEAAFLIRPQVPFPFRYAQDFFVLMNVMF